MRKRILFAALAVCLPAAGLFCADEAASVKIWDIETYVQTVLAKSDDLVQERELVRQREIAASNKNVLFAGTIEAGANLGYTAAPSNVSNAPSGISSKSTFSLNLPIIPQISVGASYDLAVSGQADSLTVTPAKNASLSATIKPFAYDVNKERAELSFASEKLSLAKTGNLVELDARRKYLNALSADTNYAIAKKTVANTKTNLDMITMRREQDLQTDADVSLATVDYYDARISEAEALSAAEDARSALSRLAKTELAEVKLILLAGLPPAAAALSELNAKALKADIVLAQLALSLDAAKLAYDRAKWTWQSLGITLGASLPGMGYSGNLSLGLSFSPSMIQDAESASIALAQAQRAVSTRETTVKDAISAATRDIELKKITVDIRNEQLADANRKLSAAKIRFEAGELLKTAMNDYDLAAQTAQAKADMARANLWISYYSLISKMNGGIQAASAASY